MKLVWFSLVVLSVSKVALDIEETPLKKLGAKCVQNSNDEWKQICAKTLHILFLIDMAKDSETLYIKENGKEAISWLIESITTMLAKQNIDVSLGDFSRTLDDVTTVLKSSPSPDLRLRIIVGLSLLSADYAKIQGNHQCQKTKEILSSSFGFDMTRKIPTSVFSPDSALTKIPKFVCESDLSGNAFFHAKIGGNRIFKKP